MTPALVFALWFATPAPPPDPAGDPFDLTYVPVANPARLVGLRPAVALGGVPGGAEQADPLLAAAAAELVAALGGTGEARRFPPVADLSQVLCEGIRLDFPTTEKRGQIAATSGWYVVRTVAPFDWAGLAAAWFPAGEMLEHAGHRYRKCGLKSEAFGGHEVHLAFYQADPRTLLVSFGEDHVKALVDRLKAGGRVTPPPLWDAVERYPLALAGSLADRTWLTVPDELPTDRPALPPFARLCRAAGGLSVGIGLEGEVVRLTAVVTAEHLPGAVDPLRAAAARTADRPWVRVAGGRATASVRVPLDDVLAALAEGNDE